MTGKHPPRFTCTGCLLPCAKDWRMQVQVNGRTADVCPTCSAIIGRVGGTVTDPDA